MIFNHNIHMNLNQKNKIIRVYGMRKFTQIHFYHSFIMTRHSSNAFVQIQVDMKLCNNKAKERLIALVKDKVFPHDMEQLKIKLLKNVPRTW